MADLFSAAALFWASWSWLLFLVVLALLVIVGVLWSRGRQALAAAEADRARTVARLQDELAERQTQLAQQEESHRNALADLERDTAAARAALGVRAARSIARTVAVLSRDPLAAGHYDAVQAAFDDLVQEPGLTSLSFFDADGIVEVATDRKMLRTTVEDQADREAMASPEIVVGERAIYVPVMSFTGRLGTLRVGYDPAA